MALLRGINLGGRTVLPMADLRRVATDCGFEPVQTYIQSGNLVFTSSARGRCVAEQLELAIAAEGGPAPAVAVRTRAELARWWPGIPTSSGRPTPSSCTSPSPCGDAAPATVDPSWSGSPPRS